MRIRVCRYKNVGVVGCVEAFLPVPSDSKASEWCSYFENDVLVKRIQDYITENLYTCTNKILRGLGKMYSGGGEITTNIDAYGGKGTAIFVADAIEIYCDNAE